MKLIRLALALLFAPLAASAAVCPTYPYTLTNGQTADANQVMANFNSVLTCANTNLATAGVNSNITALLGLTTPLSISQGGTGQTTLAGVQGALGLGTAAFLNTGTSGAAVPRLDGAAAIWTSGANFGGGVNVTGLVFGSAGGWFDTVLAQGFGIQLAADPTNTAAEFQITDTTGSVQWGLLSMSGSGQPLVSSGGYSGVMTNANGSVAVTQSPGDTSTKVATDAFAATAATNAATAATPTATTSVNGLTTLATGAQAIGGADTTHAVTPSSLASAQSLAGNGYDKLPGGLLIEWGTSGSVGSGGGTASVTYTQACASATYSVTITPTSTSGGGGWSYAAVSAVSTSGFTITNEASVSLTFYWQAICK